VESTSGKYGKERKISEPAIPASDLSRVAEETDESVSSKGHTSTADNSNKTPAKATEESEKPAFYLRKGKWPEDVLHWQAQMQAQPIPVRDLFLDQDDSSRQSTPNSASPLKMAAVAAAAVRPGSDNPEESSSALPRRPTHHWHPRHSADVPPIIMPKDAVLRRDSPDSGRLIVRRHGTKPAAALPSGGILIPRSNNKIKNNEDDLFADNDPSLVPFPRTTTAGEPVLLNERPRVLHGRFQSEIEGSSSSKRRARPSSYDELGAKSARSRIESMINLGVGSGKASASDLMFRDSLHDSTVRMRLVVREEGKPPTHFVSFFSNLTLYLTLTTTFFI
jgi:Protein kinase domain